MTDKGKTVTKIVWSFDKEVDIIEFYRDHQALWDPKHVEYCNRGKREVTLSNLVTELGNSSNGLPITVKDVKERFKNLRTTFSREVKKTEQTKKSGSGTDEVYESRWGHFKRMTFLRDSIKAGKSQDTLENDDKLSETDEGPSQMSPEKPKTNPTKKRKLESTKQTLMEEAIKILKDEKPDDGEDFFSRHVAVTLRRLPFNAREHAKLEIQQVLLKYCTSED